jgi:RHS repeat-associated protein
MNNSGDSSQWQVLEERVDEAETADRQYVWGIRYVDDLILQDDFSSGQRVRYFAMQDDQWNVVALINDSGTVVQRYAYDAYGAIQYLSPDFQPQETPDVVMPYAFTGRRLDSETGLYYYRMRYYHPTLGRFVTRELLPPWMLHNPLTEPTPFPGCDELLFQMKVDANPFTRKGKVGIEFKF